MLCCLFSATCQRSETSSLIVRLPSLFPSPSICSFQTRLLSPVIVYVRDTLPSIRNIAAGWISSLASLSPSSFIIPVFIVSLDWHVGGETFWCARRTYLCMIVFLLCPMHQPKFEFVYITPDNSVKQCQWLSADWFMLTVCVFCARVGSHSVDGGVLQSGERRSHREESTKSCPLREGSSASWYADTLAFPSTLTETFPNPWTAQWQARALLCGVCILSPRFLWELWFLTKTC